MMDLSVDWPRAHGAVLGRAKIKSEIDDFIVDEQLGFTADGEGEHLLLQVEKVAMTTLDLLAALAQRCQVAPQDIGYAGMKDRWGRTRQWISLHLPGRDAPDDLDGETWRVLQRHRHGRKLPRGCHRANRFQIRLRACDIEETALRERLDRIARDGVPNYFGEQRFGWQRNNLVAAQAALGRWQRQTSRRLSRREAMLLSALRSAWFNSVLAARVTDASWDRCLAGDVLMLDGRQSFFRPKEIDAEILRRLSELDVHPTGPLPGRGKVVVDEDVLALESACLADDSAAIAVVARLVEHDRRALRMRVRDLHLQRLDEDWCLHFELGRGSYATTVLREIATVIEDRHDADEGGES